MKDWWIDLRERQRLKHKGKAVQERKSQTVRNRRTEGGRERRREGGRCSVEEAACSLNTMKIDIMQDPLSLI